MIGTGNSLYTWRPGNRAPFICATGMIEMDIRDEDGAKGGRYVTVPPGANTWVPGRWGQQPGGGWTWIQGHWA